MNKSEFQRTNFNNSHQQPLSGEGHSPFNVTNASTECQENAESTYTIHDILVKESPCTRVASVKSANTSSASVHGAPVVGPGKLTPRGKKISNECLKRVHADSEEDDDEGVLKDDADEYMLECDDLPIISKKNSKLKHNAPSNNLNLSSMSLQESQSPINYIEQR